MDGKRGMEGMETNAEQVTPETPTKRIQICTYGKEKIRKRKESFKNAGRDGFFLSFLP